MGIYDKAAQSVLHSDRAKAVDFGGQLLANVAKIDANEETATLDITLRDGSVVTGMIGKYGSLINKPEKHTIAPADVHDAVKATIFDALGVSEKHFEH